MKEMIDNLINGNLADAKRQAQKFGLQRIAVYCRTQLGWSARKSAAAANYLKTGVGFQVYCDAE